MSFGISLIRIIPAKARYYSDKAGLKASFFFLIRIIMIQKIQFGNRHACNEFILEPGKGFSSHPHSEVEIITIVLEEELTHEDNMGNRRVLGKEDVQCITTGVSIEHSEFNREKEPLSLYYIWIYPSRGHLEPAYSIKNSKLPAGKTD